MRKHIFFCFAFYLLLTYLKCAKAQQQLGQIIINLGVGYSPMFNGNFGTGPNTNLFFPTYPIGISFDSYSDPDNPAVFKCFSIMPNLGATVDIGLFKIFSIGIASSYQSEIVRWALESNIPLNYSDKITRNNMALRFLFHAPEGDKNKHFDPYIGIRSGLSFWRDIPSQYNLINGPNATFLNEPNLTVPSVQILCGLRIFVIKNLGFHAEIGIGSPYLAEGGMSIRINTKKEAGKAEAAGKEGK
jgi:hypothetical protein